jgi:heme/copper-type cytochrome/quinol oxidase subunit 1
MGAVSSVLAGFFFWIPKITSWVYDFFIADLIFFFFIFRGKYKIFCNAFFRFCWNA